MSIHKILLLVCFTFYGILTAMSQTIITRKLPFYNELPSNEIWDFYQSDDGFMWIATTDGLARYDGNRLNMFRNDYTHSHLLSFNNITTICDCGQYIWIGTRNGLTLMDKRNNHFISDVDSQLKNADIKNILFDDKVVWVNTEEGKIYQCYDNGKVKKCFDFKEIIGQNTIVTNYLYIDQDGMVWVLTSGNGIYSYNIDKDMFQLSPSTLSIYSYCMFQDNNRRYWIGTWGDGLYEFNPKSEKPLKKHQIFANKTGQEDMTFFSIIQDDSNNYLWLLSFNELYAYKIDSQGELHKQDISNRIDIYKMYTRLFKDREGNIWLSSYDMPYLISFDYRNIENYGLKQISEKYGWDANLLDLYVDDENYIWFNQDRFGMGLYNINDNNITYLNDIEPGNLSFSLSNSSKCLWVKSSSCNKVTKYKRDGLRVTDVESYDMNTLKGENRKINDFVEDKNGRLWITDSKGLLYLCHDEKIINDNSSFILSMIISDYHGDMWGITNNSDIYNLAYDKNIVSKKVGHISLKEKNERIDKACTDKDGRIWIISSLKGLYCTDVAKQQTKSVDLGNLLLDCSPLKMITDRNSLWIVTNKKIIKLDLNNLNYKVYDSNDEDIDVNIFRNSASTSDGYGGLYVGGHNGFIHIPSHNQKSSDSWSYFPSISDIIVNNQSRLFSEENNYDDGKLILDYGDSNIEIFFSSLKFGLGGHPMIAYKLDGIDNDWIFMPLNHNSAFYNKLSKGTYQMHVKYEYAPGKWSDSRTILTIVQSAAWYNTWYAYLGYVAVFGILIYLVLITPLEHKKMKRRINELITKNKHQQAVMAETFDKEQVTIKDEDKEFIHRLSEEVEAHISDSEYTLANMAESLGMSKSTLNRNVKTAIDMTPLDFIKNYRLEKGAHLLNTTNLTISEIAYSIGFVNPKYFTKCFKEKYGVTPSEYSSQKHN